MKEKKDLSPAEKILYASQDWLITSMHSLDFVAHEKGVCKGEAHRSVKDFFSKKLDYFCELTFAMVVGIFSLFLSI